MIHVTRRSVCVVLACSVIAAFGCHGHALAASFKNLGFESAHVGTASPYTLLPVGAALPYWTCNNYVPDTVTYDAVPLDAYSVSIHDQWGVRPQNFNPLAGRYSVLLQSESAYGTPPFVNASISQTGDVPSDANWITFLSDTPSPPTLLLNGIVIATSVCDVGPTINTYDGPVNTYIADIRAFSGQNVKLKFESAGWNTLDDIQFSSEFVPEPSTLV